MVIIKTKVAAEAMTAHHMLKVSMIFFIILPTNAQEGVVSAAISTEILVPFPACAGRVEGVPSTTYTASVFSQKQL